MTETTTTTDELEALLEPDLQPDPFLAKMEEIVYQAAKDWRDEQVRLQIASKLISQPHSMAAVLRALYEGGDHATLWASIPGVNYTDITVLHRLSGYCSFSAFTEALKEGSANRVRLKYVDDKLYVFTLPGDDLDD